jgi:hypothetical protein
MPTEFEVGLLVGLLVGEGHFGGDGRQPHVTLRMHVRHEAIFQWLERTFPGGRVYGPYNHGGRHYLQWMARGPFLRDELAPLLDQYLSPGLDQHSFSRFQLMKANYPQPTETPEKHGEPAVDRAPAADTRPEVHPEPAVDRASEAHDEPAMDGQFAIRSSVPAVTPSRAATPLAELFAELRDAWPS